MIRKETAAAQDGRDITLWVARCDGCSKPLAESLSWQGAFIAAASECGVEMDGNKLLTFCGECDQ